MIFSPQLYAVLFYTDKKPLDLRSNPAGSVMRIISVVPGFVHADFRISILDFVGSLDETTAGDGNFDGLDSVLLFHPQIFAVASPAYIAANGKLESLAKPGKHCLLDYQYASKEIRAQHVHWDDMISGDLTDTDIQHNVYPDAYQAFNAAVQGQGIALIADHMIEQEIGTGMIEYADKQPTPARYSYYFLSPGDARPNSALIAFRDWLAAETKKYRSR
jgi:LysR family glycine cleavage system transcriptional activator